MKSYIHPVTKDLIIIEDAVIPPNGYVPYVLPTPTAAEVFASAKTTFESAVEQHLDITVQARGYTDVVSCASYSASTNPKFKAESLAVVAWRDAVWSYCYAELTKVQAGTRAIPASTSLFIAELPPLVW